MTDAVYYAQREQAERALAQAAKDTSVRDIHLLLADETGVGIGAVLERASGLSSRTNTSAFVIT
jgi:hypothetical protein